MNLGATQLFSLTEHSPEQPDWRDARTSCMGRAWSFRTFSKSASLTQISICSPTQKLPKPCLFGILWKLHLEAWLRKLLVFGNWFNFQLLSLLQRWGSEIQSHCLPGQPALKCSPKYSLTWHKKPLLLSSLRCSESVRSSGQESRRKTKSLFFLL